MGIVNVAQHSWCLDSDTVDKWAEADRHDLYQSVKWNLHYSKSKKEGIIRERFYRILAGGTASSKAVRQVDLALSARTPPDLSGRRIPTAIIRQIEKISNGARRVTIHKHFEGSVDYYQERDDGLVPVYRKMEQSRFIDALTRGRPGKVTAAEKRVIKQWAGELEPVRWPTLPPVEELDRCGECIGMSRKSWRGSWFGGVEDDLRRKLFWQSAPMKKYLLENGVNSKIPLMMLHPKPRQQLMNIMKFAGRLAIIAVALSNGLIEADAQNYEGSMWNLNRLLPLDARRWLNVQYDWIPGSSTGYHSIPNPWIRDLFGNDYPRVREWISTPSRYPAAYNCDPAELWPILEQSAWFWCSFIDAINGRGWGDSQAARYIREGI